MKEKIEALVLRFELLANCCEAYEKLCTEDEAILRAKWKTEKEITAYHARILRQEILGWSP